MRTAATASDETYFERFLVVGVSSPGGADHVGEKDRGGGSTGRMSGGAKSGHECNGKTHRCKAWEHGFRLPRGGRTPFQGSGRVDRVDPRDGGRRLGRVDLEVHHDRVLAAARLV